MRAGSISSGVSVGIRSSTQRRGSAQLGGPARRRCIDRLCSAPSPRRALHRSPALRPPPGAIAAPDQQSSCARWPRAAAPSLEARAGHPLSIIRDRVLDARFRPREVRGDRSNSVDLPARPPRRPHEPVGSGAGPCPNHDATQIDARSLPSAPLQLTLCCNPLAAQGAHVPAGAVEVRSYFLVFVPTIREIRDFYREM
eukprot:SAG31_NODE_3515_length_4170_cov_7.908131_5_plen_198_part_00